VQVVEVDDVGLQPLEALFAVTADRLGTAVDLPLPLGVAEHAALGGEDDLAAPVPEHAADERLVGAEAVKRRRVEHRHAELERSAEHRGRRLRGWWGPVGVRQAHAAEPESGDRERTELSRLHKLSTLSFLSFRLSTGGTSRHARAASRRRRHHTCGQA